MSSEKNQGTARKELLTALVNGILLLIAVLIAGLIDWGLWKVIGGFYRGISFYTAAILHTVFYALGAAIPLFLLDFYVARHDAAFSAKELFKDTLLGALPHLLFGVLLGFRTFVTGGVIYLAALLEYGPTLTGSDQLLDCRIQIYLLAFLLFIALYFLAKLSGSALGKWYRLKIRKELTGSIEDPLEEPRGSDRENSVKH